MPSDTAVAPPPVQAPEKATVPPAAVTVQPAEGAPSSFREGMAKARKEFEAADRGEAKPPAKAPAKAAEAKAAVKPEAGAEAKVEGAKPEDKPQSTEKKTESPFDVLEKLKIADPEKAEPKAGEKVDLSKISKEQKEAHTFKVLREKADKAEALEKELADYKAKLNGTDVETLLKEFEETKKVSEERANQLAAVDVTKSKKYIEQVAEPLGKIFDELQKKSKELGFSWKDFVDATELEDETAREDALGAVLTATEKEIKPLTQISILTSVNEYLQRQKYGAELVRNASKVQEAIKLEESKKAEEAKAITEIEANRVADIVFGTMTDKEMLKVMPFLALKDKKDAEGNPVIDPDIQKKIRGSFSLEETPHHIRALQSYSTELLPLALKDNESLRAQLTEREKRIGELTGASPSVQTADADRLAAEKDDGIPFADKLKELRARR